MQAAAMHPSVPLPANDLDYFRHFVQLLLEVREHDLTEAPLEWELPRDRTETSRHVLRSMTPDRIQYDRMLLALAHTSRALVQTEQTANCNEQPSNRGRQTVSAGFRPHPGWPHRDLPLFLYVRRPLRVNRALPARYEERKNRYGNYRYHYPLSPIRHSEDLEKVIGHSRRPALSLKLRYAARAERLRRDLQNDRIYRRITFDLARDFRRFGQRTYNNL